MVPQRNQIELRPVDLEATLAPEHPARSVWAFVEGLDLSALYTDIARWEGHAGRAAIDPRILMALWLYATIDGVGSAREIERLTQSHDALSLDLRRGEREPSHAVGFSLWLDADPQASQRRRQAAQLGAAEQRTQRVSQALQQLADIEQRKKKPPPKKDTETEEAHAKRTEPRASSTDPEARVMNMADAGFRPAYNVQFATTTDSQVIVGVEVCNSGSDLGQLAPMLDQVQQRYGQEPKEWIVDGGYPRHDDIEHAEGRGTTVYAPVPKPKDPRPGAAGAMRAAWVGSPR